MPYIAGHVPGEYDSGFWSRELRRIAEAYNIQEAIGGLNLLIPQGPVADTLTITPEVLPIWQNRTPSEDIGDGPVNVDPDPSAGDIEVKYSGIYIVNFYASLSHELGASINWAFFVNGVDIGLGVIMDASQQTSASSVSMTGVSALSGNNVIDVRASAVIGTEEISYLSASMQLFKLRDLRTRFS